LAKQLLQSVSSHLLGYEESLVIPRSWAIHVIHLIVTQLKESDCGTLPVRRTTELHPQSRYPD
jgi:hypothetical protein